VAEAPDESGEDDRGDTRAQQRSRNGSENARDMNSSDSAGKKPAKSTATHGSALFSISSYGTSIGDQAPNFDATM
jgi:hypothetical protein